LGGGQETERVEHGAIDSSSVVEKSADDLLDAGAFFFGDERTGVDGCSHLLLGTVDGGSPRTWGIDGTRWGAVLESLECFGDVAGHGHVAETFLVIPLHGDATEKCCIPVACDSVALGETFAEVFRIVFANIADEEIVDD